MRHKLMGIPPGTFHSNLKPRTTTFQKGSAALVPRFGKGQMLLPCGRFPQQQL